MDLEGSSADDIFGETNFNITFLDEADLGDFQSRWSILNWIIIGLLILSSICLSFLLIAFMVASKLRKPPRNYLVSLCAAFLVEYICAVFSNFITPGTSSCKYLGWIAYYFALVSDLWIGIICFEMWKILRESLATVIFTPGKRYNRYVRCSMLAWLLPGLALIMVLILEQIEPTSENSCFVPDIGRYSCWFALGCTGILFFYGPVIVFGSVGILFLALAGITTLTCKKSDESTLAEASKQIGLKPFVLLAFLVYFIRIVDVVNTFIDVIYLSYASIIINSLLGVYFVIVFTCIGRSHTAEMKTKAKEQSPDNEEL